MTERSRRSFLRTSVLGGAVAGGAVLLPAGLASAAESPALHDPRHRDCGCTVPPGPGQPGATRLELRVVNNSTQFQDLCVYQQPLDLGVPNALSLAWLTAPAWPSTTVAFNWTETYNFVWGQTGPLVPGTVFRSGQTWDADPNSQALQQVQLDYAQGAFTFEQGPALGNPQPGSLYIRELASIPIDTGTAGIGMSGSGTFVVPAMPNINLVFTPHPNYWVTAGTFVNGTVIDIEQITNTAEIRFPAGVTSMVATLGPDNNWTVRPDTA